MNVKGSALSKIAHNVFGKYFSYRIIILFDNHLFYQSLLLTNECTSDCLKKNNNIKIYVKIAPTCYGAVTPSSGSALFVLAKVTLC